MTEVHILENVLVNSWNKRLFVIQMVGEQKFVQNMIDWSMEHLDMFCNYQIKFTCKVAHAF